MTLYWTVINVNYGIVRNFSSFLLLLSILRMLDRKNEDLIECFG